MLEFLRKLADTSDFPARWTCGHWSAGHGYLHIVSDIGVWGAFTAAPILIGYLVVRRGDVALPKVFWLFGAALLFCGSVHLMDAILFYWPAYRVSGVLKLGTAIASWAAVLALVRVAPEALRYPALARVNAELVRTNQELDEFAYVVSHDLKAPLRGIRTLAEWIGEDSAGLSESSRADLEKLLGRTRRMEQLINGVLRYSKIGRSEIVVGPVNSDEVARGVIDDVLPPEDVVIEIPEPLPLIVYDETMLRQVFQNLITNAIAYGDKAQTVIRITIADQGGGWEFAVSDNGRGIAPEHHERIFHVFHSVNPRSEEESTGIGLAIVKRVVESLGGQVTVESKVGEGTTFRFTVPRGSGSAGGDG